MKAILFAALAALLVSVAIAGSWEHANVLHPVEDVDALCNLIGINTGCSGCVLGTKGLCKFVAFNPQETKRSVDFSENVDFRCLSSKSADVAIVQQEVVDVSFMCPADPSKEPIIRASLAQGRGDISAAVAATINTTSFTDKMAHFPTMPWPVDRTSFWEQAGAAFSNRFYGSISRHVDCSLMLSKQRVNPHCSPIMGGSVATAFDRHCARIFLSAALTTRCPAYGVAVSGVCHSYMRHIWLSGCCTAGISLFDFHMSYPDAPSAPGEFTTQYMQASPFYPLPVVPDDTPFCLNEFPIKPSGELEAFYGLNQEEEFAYGPCKI